MATPLMAGKAEAAASHAVKYGSQAWQAFKTRSPKTMKEAALESRKNTAKVKEANTALKQLTSNVGKTGGRNSAGRTTIFHRGGGAKRLYRRIDLKRSTPSMGVIERIEYDPNRSSRIALVRWAEGAHLRFQNKSKAIEKFVAPQKILEPTTTTVQCRFPLSSLCREGDQREVVFSPPGLTAAYSVVPGLDGQSTSTVVERKKTCARDVFLSAFQRAKTKTTSSPLSGSLNFPRIAVAGAKPTFFAPQMREKDEGKNTFSLCEIQKWNNHSNIWAHKMKRKAAVSWQSLEWKDTPGFAGFTESNESKK